MNIEDKINESKKRTQIMNGITIDWQYAQQILPSVLPIMARDNNPINTPEYYKLCNTLHTLFDNIEANIKNLKTMISSDVSENNIQQPVSE